MIQDATHAPPARRGFAVVDVETSGLDPQRHRIIEVAIALIDPDGRVEERWSSLVRAPGGTGPVHVHGITEAEIHGAPTFAQIAPRVCELLEGRILVAHNARFDWTFLAHEAARAGVRVPVTERLCTLTLARRLAIPARNLKLATLAEYWGIPVAGSHRADVDVTTLVAVLHRCLDEAGQQRLALPLDACRPVTGRVWRLRGALDPVRHLAHGIHGVAVSLRKKPSPPSRDDHGVA